MNNSSPCTAPASTPTQVVVQGAGYVSSHTPSYPSSKKMFRLHFIANEHFNIGSSFFIKEHFYLSNRPSNLLIDFNGLTSAIEAHSFNYLQPLEVTIAIGNKGFFNLRDVKILGHVEFNPTQYLTWFALTNFPHPELFPEDIKNQIAENKAYLKAAPKSEDLFAAQKIEDKMPYLRWKSNSGKIQDLICVFRSQTPVQFQ